MMTATVASSVQAGSAAVFWTLFTFCASAATADEKEKANKQQTEDLTHLDLSTLMTMDVMLVTAQKREQNLQEVGTSITVLDARLLEKLNLSDATDLVVHVPGLRFNWFGSSLTVYNLRGVSQNDYGDHQEAPVAVYSDEGYVGAMGALAGSVFDLERVEVLRGPQGTLFGRNATGGLIHYISRKPTDRADGYLQVTAGDFNQLETEGAVNTPLADSVAARFSFATARRDGIVRNRIGDDVNDQNQYAVRTQLLFKLSDASDFLLKVHGLRNIRERVGNFSWTAAVPDENGLGRLLGRNENFWGNCPGCDLDGYRNPGTDVFDQAISTPGRFDRSVYGSTARLNLQLSHGVTLTSVTDYMQMQKDYREHSNPSPISPIFFETHQTYHQWSEELRFSGDREALRWITGLYYLDRDTRNRQVSIFGGTFTVEPGANAENRYFIPTNSAAVFGQTEWDISPLFTLITGLRYTHDKISHHYAVYDLLPGIPPTPTLVFNPATDPDLASRSFNAVSWKVEADFKPRANLLFYASISRGTKGGGYSAPSFNTSIFGSPPLAGSRLAYDPEKLTSYEAGEKWAFLDGAARLNSSVFHYDYKDYQGLTNVNFLNTVGNYEARIQGAEMELDVIPARGLTISAGLSYLDAVVHDIPLPSGIIVDRDMPQAPEWSITSLVRYEWPAGNGTASVQTNWKFDDGQYFTMLNNPDDFEPAHTTGNVRVGWANKTLDVGVFCRNVTDRRYRTFSADASGFGFLQSIYAAPRWFGVSATYRWN